MLVIFLHRCIQASQQLWEVGIIVEGPEFNPGLYDSWGYFPRSEY